MENKKYVFIGGLHRSGTSILYKILGTSDKVSKHSNTGVPEDEGQHLQTVYPPAYKYGGPGKFAFDDKYHYTESSKLINDKNKNKIIKEWSNLWDLEKLILLEKSPPNIIHTRFLQEIVENSYFIIIMRHPIVVSRATMKWNRQPLEKHIDHWIKAHILLYDDITHINNVIIIKYEDLCSNPSKFIKALEEMLGENLNIPPKSLNQLKSSNKKYLVKPIPKNIIKLYENKVNQFGYTLK